MIPVERIPYSIPFIFFLWCFVNYIFRHQSYAKWRIFVLFLSLEFTLKNNWRYAKGCGGLSFFHTSSPSKEVCLLPCLPPPPTRNSNRRATFSDGKTDIPKSMQEWLLSLWAFSPVLGFCGQMSENQALLSHSRTESTFQSCRRPIAYFCQQEWPQILSKIET